MTIRHTLLASALLSTALVVVVGSIGAGNRLAVDRELRAVEEESLPIIEALEDVRFAGVRIVASTSEYVLLRALAERPTAEPDAADNAELEGARDEERQLRGSGEALFDSALEALRHLDEVHHLAVDRHGLADAGRALVRESGHLLDLADAGAPRATLLEAKEAFEQREGAFLRVVDAEIDRAAAGLNERSANVRQRVTRDFRTSVAVLVVASLLALLAGLYVATIIRRPLEALRAASEQIAQGRYDVSLPVEADDEIGDVARAFDAMAAGLARTTVSKSFVDDIVASIPDGLIVADHEGRIRRTNRALTDLAGLSNDRSLLGRTVDDVLPGVRAVAGDRSATVTALTSVNGPVPVAVVVSPVTGTGHGQGYVCLVQDIRERLAVEHALTDAKEQAEAGTRAKGDFLATMSHELRTPLNAVIGYAELLLDDGAARLIESDRHDLERIRSAGRLLLELVNQVLDLARLDAGRIELTLAPVDAAAVVTEVAEVVRPMLSAETSLRVEIAADLSPLLTDGSKLRQVLLNLVSNACKFTPRGEVRLAARRCDGPDGACVAFVVADTGLGMTPEFLQELFTPFTQARTGPRGKFAGSGLGLAISKRLGDLLGARLQVRSVLGEGTEFTLSVPLTRETSARAAA